MCIFWGIYDLDAPQYQPTEADGFIEKFGEDSPYRSFKFYGSEDKEHFSRTRSEMLQSLPPPRRFVGKIYGPKGAQVKQSWHLGGMWKPNPAERWESYFGDVTHIPIKREEKGEMGQGENGDKKSFSFSSFPPPPYPISPLSSSLHLPRSPPATPTSRRQ